MKRNITLLTRSLAHGGTERQIVILARALRACGQPINVLSLYSEAALQDDLSRAGVPGSSLSKKGRWDTLPFFCRLVTALREHSTEILYSFLAVPNILSVLLKGILPGLKVVWGVRASGLGSVKLDCLGGMVQSLEARLSGNADLIIANSSAGLRYAASRGFPRERLRIVHNGIDLEALRPDRSLGLRLRSGWKIRDGEKVIGIVARLDPLKDHALFLSAAARWISCYPQTRFVCVGSGDPKYANFLIGLSRRLGIDERIVWTGDRSDMLDIYNSLDILTLCSETEGFPNALAEGMACGIPAVATDVGDCRRIIDGIGVVVKSRTPQALCEAWKEMLDKLSGRESEIATEARRRIAERYSIQQLVTQTIALMDTLEA